MRHTWLTVLFFLSLSGFCSAQSISLTAGTVSRQITLSDLSAGPGTDFASPILFPDAGSPFYCDVVAGTTWSVAVRTTSQSLPAGASLGLSRRSPLSIVTLNGTDQTVFSGNGNESVNLVLALIGITATNLTASSYSAGLLYTITAP